MNNQSKPLYSIPNIQFFGAVGTVTGSRYLLTTKEHRVLIDCGMFQGLKELRLRNWRPFPVEPESIEAILLTHAHLDHSGYIPALVRQGFKGKIYSTRATFELCKILLKDAAKLQEEDAEYNNRHHTSKHQPALPLFTSEDTEQALELFEPLEDNQLDMGDIKATWHPNGHILGSCYLDVVAEGRHILFSGDMGRFHDVIMKPPTPPCYADILITESTYGDRDHSHRDVEAALADCVTETLSKGGNLLIPSFAVGRSQAVLYLLYKLREENRIPHVPIYLDSPMAISATELMLRYHEEHRLTAQQCRAIEKDVHFVRTVEQSIALNHIDTPMIIVSASGMATGGRVLFHLERMLGDQRNTILFAGFQAAGTRGARLVKGEDRVRIHGQFYPVKANIEYFEFLSAHADRNELLRWMKKMPVAPKQVLVTHGEQESASSFAETIRSELGWRASCPSLGDIFEL